MDELLRSLRGEAHNLEGSEVTVWLSKRSAELASHPDLDAISTILEDIGTIEHGPHQVRVVSARVRTVIRRALARRDVERRERLYENNSKYGMF
jgi:hypothetical protein